MGPEIVVCAERQRVDRMTARLRDVIECRCSDRAERRFAKVERASDVSVRNCEAVYAAAQMLRDLDVIDDEEAAFIADDCYEARCEEFLDHDRVYRQLIESAARADSDTGVHNELGARARELAAIFHEARGETRWAAMLRDGDSSFSAYAVEGELRLFGSEFVPCDALASIDAPCEPAKAAAILERLLAMMAGETIKEVVVARGVFSDVVGEGNARSALAAFGQALEMGVITKAQHAALVYEIVGNWWRTVMESDHEMMRLERRHEAAIAASEKTPASREDAERARIDLERLSERCLARSDALLAGLLRQLGEHAIASAYVADPRGFEISASEVWVGDAAVFER
jgi:hypothetical protein